MEKDNVKQFPKLVSEETMEPRELTEEEIDYIMKKDEEELDGYLKKFSTVALPDSSKVEEEDEEEEETITLDFTEDGIQAYEKVGEGVAVRDADGNVSLVDDEKLAEKIQGLINDRKPPLQAKYEDFITQRFVSKAIGSLIEKLNKAYEAVEDTVEEQMKHVPFATGAAEKASKDLWDKKQELRRAYNGSGGVAYDRIPQWAESYIEEYIQNAINTMLDFTERD